MNGGLTATEVAEALETFVRVNYHIAADDEHFTRDVDLWDTGYVDSTGVIEIIAFLEQQLGRMLPESVLFSPQFRSINGIAQLVLEL
jgi:acyl carrier protein